MSICTPSRLSRDAQTISKVALRLQHFSFDQLIDGGEVTVVADGFKTPSAVKFDSLGRLHVLDQQHLGEIWRIDPASGQKKLIARSEVGIDNLAFDSRDRLYITNAHNGTVSRVLPWGFAWPLKRGGLVAPGGIALLQPSYGRKSLFVADVYSLREYSPRTGRPRSVAHSIVGGITALNTPFTLAPINRHLVTTSWFANAVQIWDVEQHEVIEDHRDFIVPLNAIGFEGDLIVAELGSGCVVRRPSASGDKTPLACGFLVPAGLAVWQNNLWVGDRASGIVKQLVADGQVLDPPPLVASGLLHPEGLAATPAGDLLVVETGARRLIEINRTTGIPSVIAENLPIGAPATPGYPPTWIFNAVAIDEHGNIYLSLDQSREIVKLTRQ